MALEIRELVVKVTVEDQNKISDGKLTLKDKKTLIDQCKKEVLKELSRKNRR